MQRVLHQRESGPWRSGRARAVPTARGLLIVAIWVSAALVATSVPAARAGDLDLTDTSRLRVGVGDRLSIEHDGRWIPTLDLLDRLDAPIDMLQIWLPRGWKKEWVAPQDLEALHERGVVPVVVHYFFGDDISKERVEAQRGEWYASLWEMAQQLRGDHPVLVILEPEFNIAPPRGETPITEWPWFANDLRAAAIMLRKEAPNVLVGTCPGDFPGPPNLERVLGPVAGDLDFLAFQEMRASTDRDSGRDSYVDVGHSAVEYARYLQRAFGRPLLLGYLAVSSHGGWVKPQRDILEGVFAQSDALRKAGVFGVLYFQLFDDVHHRGYFGPAEKHFGLITAEGRKKPAFDVFLEGARRGRAPAAPPDPPASPSSGRRR